MQGSARAGYPDSRGNGPRCLASGKHRLQASWRAAPAQLVSSLVLSWNTRLIIISERSRFRRIYSFLEIPACLSVISRNIQGEEVLQHQERLPKQVCLPISSCVPRTASSFILMYVSLGIPILVRAGIRGHSLTGIQQNVRDRMSPPRQSCFGALYHPSSSAYLVMAASSPASVLISDWRATETRSAPWESMSFMRSKVVMELLAISTRGHAFRICRSFAVPKSIRSTW